MSVQESRYLEFESTSTLFLSVVYRIRNLRHSTYGVLHKLKTKIFSFPCIVSANIIHNHDTLCKEVSIL